jgi:hypothetical protein
VAARTPCGGLARARRRHGPGHHARHGHDRGDGLSARSRTAVGQAGRAGRRDAHRLGSRLGRAGEPAGRGARRRLPRCARPRRARRDGRSHPAGARGPESAHGIVGVVHGAGVRSAGPGRWRPRPVQARRPAAPRLARGRCASGAPRRKAGDARRPDPGLHRHGRQPDPVRRGARRAGPRPRGLRPRQCAALDRACVAGRRISRRAGHSVVALRGRTRLRATATTAADCS